MRPKICWQDLESFDFPIILTQTAKNEFIVTYGQEVQSHLTYGQAARSLGSAIMHALACKGKLDNDTDRFR